MHYTQEDYRQIGLGSVGQNVQIDKSVIFIKPEKVHIGNNVRIDAFCIFSAGSGITIGNNVHIAAYVQLAGNGGHIQVSDFAGISARTSIYTATDDYREGYLTGPTVPDEYKKVRKGPVVLDKHVIVGCGSVILPNVTLKIGSSVGALTLINKDVQEYEIVAGRPPQLLGHRDKVRLHELESRYLENNYLDNHILGVETWLTHSED
jgi:dTDP-4-amino-4,6-dideoxy-D-glucose acyltransferase